MGEDVGFGTLSDARTVSDDGDGGVRGVESVEPRRATFVVNAAFEALLPWGANLSSELKELEGQFTLPPLE